MHSERVFAGDGRLRTGGNDVDAQAQEDFRCYVAARSPALLRTAYVLTGHRADAEDLLQTALVLIDRPSGTQDDFLVVLPGDGDFGQPLFSGPVEELLAIRE